MPAPVYLVRHGESVWNLRRLTQGQTAHPRLTPRGQEQATRAAHQVKTDLAGRPVEQIVSSDLSRAAETAEIIAAIVGGEVRLDARLREQALGSLEGRSYEETWAAADAHDWSDPTLPVAGGESRLDVTDRMVAALADLAARSGPVVVVSHGDAIRAALAHLTDFAPQEAPWVDVPNGAVGRWDGVLTWL